MHAAPLLRLFTGLTAGGLCALLIHPPPTFRPDGKEEVAAGTAAPAPASELNGREGMEVEWRGVQTGPLMGLPRRLELARLVESASPGDMARLLALAENDQEARTMLLRRWAGMDPEAAADWLAPWMAGEPTSGMNDDDVMTVFGEWGRRDPAAAWKKIGGLCSLGRDPNYERIRIFEHIMETDMEAGVKFAAVGGLSLETFFLGGQSMLSADLSRWVEQDPAKAARLLEGLPQGEFRDSSLSRAISTLAMTDLAAAIALQLKFPDLTQGEFQKDNRGGFYAQWARQDLNGMMEFINDAASSETRYAMKEAVARHLGDSSPEHALAWADENLSGARRYGAVESILTGLATQDPPAALRYLQSLPEGSALNRAVEAFSKTVPPENFAALLDSAASLPDGAARQNLTAKAYEKWYQRDPGTLIQSLSSQPPEEISPGLWKSLGRQTATLEDGMGRLAMLPQGASGEFAKGLFDEQFFGWKTNLEQITAVVEGLQTPELRATAIAAATRHQAFRGPENLVEWGKSLPSPEER